MPEACNLSLPRPYEGELLYSVFARYESYLQPSSKDGFRRTVAETKYVPVTYGKNLNELAQRTYSTWKLSALDILDRHTLYPYDTFYMMSGVQAAQKFYTERRHQKSFNGRVGVPTPTHLRYCRSCVRRDLDTFGETYWRRQHQLSGVLLCSEHKEILVNGVSRSSANYDLYDATTVWCPDALECETLTESEHQLALDVARRCLSLMTSPSPRWLSLSHPMHLYRQAALRLGYEFAVQKLDAKRVADDFYQFYGTEFLNKLGIKISSHFTQVQKLLHGHLEHPLFHILMQLFLERQLESRKIDLQIKPRLTSHIRCPNPYAEHPVDFRIKDIVRRKSAERGEYFAAYCSCGYAFSFRDTDKRDCTVPIVLKPFRYGSTFVREARRLYKEKPSPTYVAARMGLSRKLVGRLIKGTTERHDREAKPIAQWRAEWKEARSKTAYESLLKWDRDWILAQGKRKQSKTPKRFAISVQDDAAIASEIGDGARALLSVMPPQQVSCIAICRQIGRPTLYMRLRSLPLSRAEMSRVRESRAEWLKRKSAMNG
ncbi:hypothetical protein V1277_002826 [Bradyrhizobium sp. AZCC 1588]|uniref:TnsD family Tn7-like transposition protein n=1 Tax=unclassified Bradyrhizobium TaxID=2631580 RepID=UPI0030212D33